MGEAEIQQYNRQLVTRSIFFFYGNAANNELSKQIARDIQNHWNEGDATVIINHDRYKVIFKIDGFCKKELSATEVYENTNPKNNYFRIEESSAMEVSFVDGIGCNTGYFLLSNLLQDSTTAAHEYGHTLGLIHPHELDIRGRGIPGIMYPRGTVVDAMHQYNPNALAGDNTNGGTMNPLSRKVLQKDIDNLKLNKLSFDKNGFAVVGEFSSVWHEAHK